jgi:hypothetical protein
VPQLPLRFPSTVGRIARSKDEPPYIVTRYGQFEPWLRSAAAHEDGNRDPKAASGVSLATGLTSVSRIPDPRFDKDGHVVSFSLAIREDHKGELTFMLSPMFRDGAVRGNKN